MRSELQIPVALDSRAGTRYLTVKQGAQRSPEEVRQKLPEKKALRAQGVLWD